MGWFASLLKFSSIAWSVASSMPVTGATSADSLMPALEVESLASTSIAKIRTRSLEFNFSNGRHVNLANYPPPPIIWIYNTIDVICTPMGCAEKWRSPVLALMNNYNNDTASSSSSTSWFSDRYRLPPVMEDFPELLTFTEFVQTYSASPSPSLPLGETLHLLYQYAFETDSTELGVVTSTAAALVVLVLLVFIRFVKNNIFLPYFSKILLNLAISSHGISWTTKKENIERISKFSEYCFRLIYHVISSLYGIYFFYDKPWWTDMKYCYQGYPLHPIEPSMAWYYILQCAYNLEVFISLFEIYVSIGIRLPVRANHDKMITKCTNDNTSKQELSPAKRHAQRGKENNLIFQMPVYIIWKETSRDDFKEMFMHHLLTNALVIGSSFSRYNRPGMMVFLLHDISDVPVVLSKLTNFVKWKLTTAICFVSMCVVWLYTRLYLFPVHIWYGSFSTAHYVLEEGRVSPLVYLCYREFFFVSMALLISLHAMWFRKFMCIFAVKYTLIRNTKNRELESMTATQKKLS
jgi:TLC domain